jgi:hypothetical protein
MGYEKIIVRPWLYTLYKSDEGTFVLSVLCGGAGMYELNLPLEAGQMINAHVGDDYLEKLANKVRANPERYADSSIRLEEE